MLGVGSSENDKELLILQKITVLIVKQQTKGRLRELNEESKVDIQV